MLLGLALLVGCGGERELAGRDIFDDLEFEEATGPLDAFFESSGGIAAIESDWQLRVQEQVALCMRAEGFEYEPVAPPSALGPSSLDRQGVAALGYGISTRYEELVGVLSANVNQRQVIELSAAERDEYVRTLQGAAEPGALASGDLESRGCQGAAILELVPGDVISATGDFSAERQAALAEFQASPEMVQAAAHWSACMHEAGYPYSRFDEPRLEITDRLGRIAAEVDTNLVLPGAAALRALLDEPPVTWPGFDGAALAQLEDDERAIATADYDCYVEHVQFQFADRRNEIEITLMRAHSDGLLEFREALGQ